MNFKLLKASLLAAIGIAATLPSMSANTLTPGNTVNPDVFGSGSGFTFVASTGPINIDPVPGLSFNATYTEYAYRDANNVFCSGCLDFFVNVSNAGPGIFERVTTSSFDGSLTDVGYNTVGIAGGPVAPAGGVTPFNVDRSANGNVIGFNFIPTGTPVSAGQSSALLEIQTNARDLSPGFVSVQDGTSGFGVGFQPAATAPEPMSMALLGTGLLCIGLSKRFSRNRSKE